MRAETATVLKVIYLLYLEPPTSPIIAGLSPAFFVGGFLTFVSCLRGLNVTYFLSYKKVNAN